MWNKLFAIYINLLFFMNPLYNTYLSLRGISQESGQLQYICIALFIFSLVFYFKWYIFGPNKITWRQVRIFVAMFIIGFLYYLSGVIYHDMPHGYYAAFLYWGSMGISAVLAGIMINRIDRLIEVSKLLPIFTIFTTIIVSIYAYNGSEMVRNNDYNWNYQSISYFMANCFLFNAYYLFFFKNTKSFITKIIKIAVSITMVANLFLKLNAGGRGATVLIIFSIFYLLYYLLRNHIIKPHNLILICLAFILIFIYIANSFNLWESSGFDRVTHMLQYNTETRENSYTIAIQYWTMSPFIGYGVGSIWHTVGFYSHNLFCDLLSESGVIGTSIILSLLIISLTRIYKLTRLYNEYMLILFYSFTGLIMLMFSSYWISNETFWFILSAALSIDFKQIVYNKKIYK